MKKTSLLAALRSGKGRVRANNEDAFYFHGKFAEIDAMDQDTSLFDEIHGQSALFAICDGMGGYENGEVASYTAVSRMPELQQSLVSADFASTLTDWVGKTNDIIIQIAKDGGCTLALLYYNEEKIYVAHIGDSRIYRYHSGALTRCTKDHSKLQVLLDAGILSEKEAETYPQRHVITRALGMNEEDNGKCLPTVQEPIRAENSDRYLICSDGVTDMLNDQQLYDIISKNANPQNCAETVFQAAMDAGGKDNTSVIVIDVICADNEDDADCQKSDPYESTLMPCQQDAYTITIEHTTTIKRADGQSYTIKSQVSGSSQRGSL